MKENKAKKTTPETEFATALGYSEIKVNFRQRSEDSGQKSEPQTVRIYQTRLRDVPKYHQILFSDEEKLIELVCQRDVGSGKWEPVPAGFAESLTVESANEILKIEQELNYPLWSAWFRRMTSRNETLMPGTTDIVAQALKAIKEKAAASPSGESASAPV